MIFSKFIVIGRTINWTRSTAKAADFTFFKNATLAGKVTGLVATGYWNMQRTSGSDANGKVTLLWDSSLSALVGTEIEALVIAGYNGTDWIDIPADAATGNISAGTITSTSDVDL